jgi:phosphatidylglycerol---prolipoprotein diacylglyceryl transferase
MFWRNYLPDPIFFSFGPIDIHWYGLILVLAIVVSAWQAKKYFVKKAILTANKFEDLAFYIIIFGLLGARFGHVVFFELAYYLQNPLDIFKVWQGGLSIQGALLFGFLTVIIWARKYKINFWKLTDGIVLVVPLGQVIGRWGNYFNQELFGKPTNGWWSIPIATYNRVEGYEIYKYFHPAFFYESLLNLVLFFILYKLAFKNILKRGTLTLVYFIGYGIIRFFMEFIRIDDTLLVFGMRLPQVISIGLISLALILIYYLNLRPLPKHQK